jgi:hypothetical protein
MGLTVAMAIGLMTPLGYSCVGDKIALNEELKGGSGIVPHQFFGSFGSVVRVLKG